MSVYFEAKEAIDRLQGLLIAGQEEGDIGPALANALNKQIHYLFTYLVMGRPEGDAWMTKAVIWLADKINKMVGEDNPDIVNHILLDGVERLIGVVTKK
jgi:hypothetical protein